MPSEHEPKPAPPGGTRPGDRDTAAALDAWFERHARDLPWRPRPLGAPRDRYHALVSELMLQQTQVARVIGRFGSFLERFPTIEAVADADEQDVLSEWQGLGYYRRARLLHAAARDIVDRFGGAVPEDAETLVTIPGIGRYTAGAIASIAAGHPAPIVDGNVTRVVLRLDGRDLVPGTPGADRHVWARAAELVASAERPGVFNEALMELGATVCTPRSPRCLFCPLADACVAHERGLQDEIPAPKPRAKRRELFATVAVLRSPRGQIRVEQRPDDGLWAAMWQAPTIERDDRHATDAELAESLGIDRGTLTGLLADPIADPVEFAHQTTHRIVRFRAVFAALPPGLRPRRGRWAGRSEAATLAMSNPQRRLIEALTTPASSGLPDNA